MFRTLLLFLAGAAALRADGSMGELLNTWGKVYVFDDPYNVAEILRGVARTVSADWYQKFFITIGTVSLLIWGWKARKGGFETVEAALREIFVLIAVWIFFFSNVSTIYLVDMRWERGSVDFVEGSSAGFGHEYRPVYQIDGLPWGLTLSATLGSLGVQAVIDEAVASFSSVTESGSAVAGFLDYGFGKAAQTASKLMEGDDIYFPREFRTNFTAYVQKCVLEEAVVRNSGTLEVLTRTDQDYFDAIAPAALGISDVGWVSTIHTPASGESCGEFWTNHIDNERTAIQGADGVVEKALKAMFQENNFDQISYILANRYYVRLADPGDTTFDQAASTAQVKNLAGQMALSKMVISAAQASALEQGTDTQALANALGAETSKANMIREGATGIFRFILDIFPSAHKIMQMVIYLSIVFIPIFALWGGSEKAIQVMVGYIGSVMSLELVKLGMAVLEIVQENMMYKDAASLLAAMNAGGVETFGSIDGSHAYIMHLAQMEGVLGAVGMVIIFAIPTLATKGSAKLGESIGGVLAKYGGQDAGVDTGAKQTAFDEEQRRLKSDANARAWFEKNGLQIPDGIGATEYYEQYRNNMRSVATGANLGTHLQSEADRKLMGSGVGAEAVASTQNTLATGTEAEIIGFDKLNQATFNSSAASAQGSYQHGLALESAGLVGPSGTTAEFREAMLVNSAVQSAGTLASAKGHKDAGVINADGTRGENFDDWIEGGSASTAFADMTTTGTGNRYKRTTPAEREEIQTALEHGGKEVVEGKIPTGRFINLDEEKGGYGGDTDASARASAAAGFDRFRDTIQGGQKLLNRYGDDVVAGSTTFQNQGKTFTVSANEVSANLAEMNVQAKIGKGTAAGKILAEDPDAYAATAMGGELSQTKSALAKFRTLGGAEAAADVDARSSAIKSAQMAGDVSGTEEAAKKIAKGGEEIGDALERVAKNMANIGLQQKEGQSTNLKEMMNSPKKIEDFVKKSIELADKAGRGKEVREDFTKAGLLDKEGNVDASNWVRAKAYLNANNMNSHNALVAGGMVFSGGLGENASVQANALDSLSYGSKTDFYNNVKNLVNTNPQARAALMGAKSDQEAAAVLANYEGIQWGTSMKNLAAMGGAQGLQAMLGNEAEPEVAGAVAMGGGGIVGGSMALYGLNQRTMEPVFDAEGNKVLDKNGKPVKRGVVGRSTRRLWDNATNSFDRLVGGEPTTQSSDRSIHSSSNESDNHQPNENHHSSGNGPSDQVHHGDTPSSKSKDSIASSGGRSKLRAEALGEAVETAGKAGWKSAAKKVPLLGLFAGGAFAAERAMDGDFVGAGMELASGLAGAVPGVGTAASLGIDGALLARDLQGGSSAAAQALAVSPGTTGRPGQNEETTATVKEQYVRDEAGRQGAGGERTETVKTTTGSDMAAGSSTGYTDATGGKIPQGQPLTSDAVSADINNLFRGNAREFDTFASGRGGAGFTLETLDGGGQVVTYGRTGNLQIGGVETAIPYDHFQRGIQENPAVGTQISDALTMGADPRVAEGVTNVQTLAQQLQYGVNGTRSDTGEALDMMEDLGKQVNRLEFPGDDGRTRRY